MSTHTIASSIERPRGAMPQITALVAAGALVLSGLALLVGELILPSSAIPQDAAGLPALLDTLPAYRLSQWMSFAFAILITPGMIGVAAVAYQRRAWAAYIGAALALVGNLFHPGAFAYEGIILPSMARLPEQQATMGALLDQMGNDTALVPLLALVLVFNLGLLVMAIGLWRRRLIPAWAAGVGVAALLLELIVEEQQVVHLVALALFTVFLAVVGVALVRHTKPEAAA
jgi:hypothetical protein